jgi:anion-transporting  ArsA/GET3 family ATPase
VELRDRLWWLGVDPERSVGEWLAHRAGAPAAALLRRSQAFSYLFAAAPGAAQLATIGKIAEEARAGRFAPVIVDGPATGHALALLAAPATFAGLGRTGPVAGDARDVRDLLRDGARAAYVVAALPEEMAVSETLELDHGLREAVGRGPDLIVVDAVHPDRFSDAEAALMQRSAPRELAPVLAEHRRARRQAAAVRELRARTHAPVVTLPFVFPPAGGVERLERLAAVLAQAP